jgi:glycogen debranching enzyme
VKDENEMLSIDLTNPPIEARSLDKGVLHLSRTKFLLSGFCYERIGLQNFDTREHQIECSFSFASDFRDIFEVRGLRRQKQGTLLPPEMRSRDLSIAYRGLDHVNRKAVVQFYCDVEWREGDTAVCKLSLAPSQSVEIGYSVRCMVSTSDQGPIDDREALDKLGKTIREKQEKVSDIQTSHEQFTGWVLRCKNDLIALLAETEFGMFPYAGVPWYNTPFGRDGIITALSCLWVAPEVAKGVLLYLAGTQCRESDPFRDAEPGKILHEARGGEMANLNEIPFKRYYGTVDATPLFIMLAGHYFKRTNDSETIERIWENIELGIAWIENYGDRDGDGFVEYQQCLESGLSNQGWKDSFDSISYENGELAEAPIALCEVQGYVYDAYKQASYLAKHLDKTDSSKLWLDRARTLKRKFNEEFWDEESATFVLALDKNKRPCRVKTSNAGQCLFTRIADHSKASKLVKTLMRRDLFSGWGIRTLSSTEIRFNPMSYHNGSVWPHDTAIIAAGMANYGFNNQAIELMSGLFFASLYVDLQRLPELFCGFPARRGEGPTSYPVACSPQAWAVTAVYLLLQSCLKITIDAPRRILSLDNPKLPDYLAKVKVVNLVVAEGYFDLEFHRNEWDVSLLIVNKPKGWKVIIRR